MNKMYNLLITCLVIMVMIGCKKLDDLEKLEVTPQDAEYAIPLFNASLSFEELVDNFDENTFICIDDDGLMTLKYRGGLLRSTSEELFDFLSFIPIPMTDTMAVVDFTFANNLEFDYARLKAGVLSIYFESFHEEDVSVEFIFHSLSKNGEVFKRTYNVEYDGTLPEFASSIGISLVGYELTSAGNQLTASYIAIKADGTRDTLSNFIVGMTGVEFEYLEGFLGNDIYEVGKDTIEIDFFKDWTQGNVYFEEPIFRLVASNSFGFPLDAELQSINVISINGDELPLESIYVDEGITVDYPKLNEIGETKNTEFVFNKDNSNIDDILSSAPIALAYDLGGEPNPDIDTSIRGFITDSSELNVMMEVDLPMYGTASNFLVTDTFDINLEEYESVKSAEFKLVSENETGLDVEMQLYFLDAQNNVLDSLLSPVESIIEAAPADADGNVTQTVEKTLILPYPAERFDNLMNTKKILLQAGFSTYNNGSVSVKVLSVQKVDVRMGLKFGT